MSLKPYLVVAALLLSLVSVAFSAETVSRPYTRSWIYIDPSCNTRVMKSGEAWEVPIEYSLDAAEVPLARTIEVFVPGPWMDGPDGKYVKERHHETYPDMSRSIKVQAGQHREVLRFTVPPAKPQGNSLLVIAAFSGEKGRWPWESRMGGVDFVRNTGFFELETDRPGNLFTYDEPVQLVMRLTNVKESGDRKLTYKVTAPGGSVVARGEIPLTARQTDQRVAIPVEVNARGIFMAEVSVDGWETRHTIFARIPDVLKLTNNEPTRFGLHDIIVPAPKDRVVATAQIARRLGLTACRQMVRWDALEPGPGIFKLEPMDMPLDVAKQYAIDPVIMVDHPPAWVQTGPGLPGNIQYAPFQADWAAWATFVRTATTHFKGRMYAWEWLNEIVPGDDSNAVENYVNLCRVGTKTAREVDPKIVTTLAGGLWPRNFRNALLTAGVGDYVDVLPIHYSDGSAVRQARADLQAVGKDLTIWDNETAHVVNAWDVPPQEQIADKSQSQWMLTHWTEELSAGAQRIFWFGGQPDPAGNWSYLLGDLSPRPVAATLAVYAAKMHRVAPVGAYSAGGNSKIHVFYRDGKAILVAWADRRATVPLVVGTDSLLVTDYQGNETALACPGSRIAQVELSPLPVFIENANADVVRAFVTTTVVGSDDPTKTPRLTLLTSSGGALQARVQNPFEAALSGRLQVVVPEGWSSPEAVAFDLKPGGSRIVPITLRPPADAKVAETPVSLQINFARRDLPQVKLPIIASVIAPEMLGNLLPNGDFETGGNGRPASWGMGQDVQWIDASEEGLGHKMLRFNDTKGGYRDASNTINLAGGQTYLYSAWVANQDMPGGSNIAQRFKDGSSRTLFNVQVFVTPPTIPYWQLYTAHYQAPPDVVAATFLPVVKGSGWALYDNIRVTRYEGTDYMAEAYRAKTPPKVDGRLDDWEKLCPIPLLAPNQLTALDKSYKWTPQNLRGVAYVCWDDANLYVAVRVQDDRHVADTTGEDTPNGDSLVLGFDPTGKGPDAGQASFAYYISSANPGGGSGKATVYRPPSHAGGLSSGQLLRDSSVYDLAILQEMGVCTYEIRIPFSELGAIRPGLGSRFGFTIQINDNDGNGRAAHMDWGQGLGASWQPMNFGCMTLLQEAK